MDTSKDGDTNICEVCQLAIEYKSARWQHVDKTEVHWHQAWPRSPKKNYIVIPQPTGEARAWWGY